MHHTAGSRWMAPQPGRIRRVAPIAGAQVPGSARSFSVVYQPLVAAN